jgi:RNA polymerase sigma factor (sigma-70 family)
MTAKTGRACGAALFVDRAMTSAPRPESYEHERASNIGSMATQVEVEISSTAPPRADRLFYRMLGSPFEPRTPVQDTFVRAWRGYDRFEAARRCAPGSTGSRRTSASTCSAAASAARGRWISARARAVVENLHTPEVPWLQPVPDSLVRRAPAELAARGETIRLAFVAALQHLPPRQRAVLILCEVLRWKATEVAELLETTVASVNSALQRARATLDEAHAAARRTLDERPASSSRATSRRSRPTTWTR